MKNKLLIAVILVCLFYLFSCSYSKDKLIIQNNSRKEICYQTLIMDKKSHKFYQVSAGGNLKPGNGNSPLVRQNIFQGLTMHSADSCLYVVFHNCNDLQDVYKHIDSIVFNKKYLVKEFSRKDLDSLHWLIKFD